MGVILMICGINWIIFSLINTPKNFISAIIFKVIPFLTGLATTLCAMDVLGWVNIF